MLLQGDLRSLISTLNFNSQLGDYYQIPQLLVLQGKASKKNDKLSFVCDFPRNDYFTLETVPQNCEQYSSFHCKGGWKKYPYPLLWVELSQIKMLTLSLKIPGY